MGKRNFQGKVVLVTGAASGIGWALCNRFARAGARIGLLDMDRSALDSCKNQLAGQGTQTFAVHCDVSDQRSCESAVRAVAEHFGGIDVLVNNAGITQRGAFMDTRIDVFRQVMAVNFFGSLYCTKAAIETLVKRRGMIIVNESLAGLAPLLGRCGYSASKHALHGLFTSLRSEVRNRGVHIMIVCPGFIRTNLQKRALGCDGTVTDHPQSRLGAQGTPEAAATAIYHGAVREKNLLVLTPVGKLAYWISRIAPSLYERIMAAGLRSELEAQPEKSAHGKGSWD